METVTATSPKRIVTYYRVSTKKQGDSGLGLAAQRTYIEHFYGTATVLGEFTDIESGKDVANRPQLKEALALCQSEKATLVIAKIDRLSRNTEQALVIYRELDGRLESCDIPNLDKFTLTLFMAIADRERELIAVRTKTALVEKVRQCGEWRSGSNPFRDGSASNKASDVLRTMARQNENNRRASALVSTLRGSGKTWAAIAEDLNKAGFKTSRNKSFQATQAQRLYNRSELAS